MITAAHDQTFEQRLAKVDLTAVMNHVAKETGLSAAELARAEDLYRKFLTLKGRVSGVTFVPPQIVDIVWHTHITFTRQYMADCELLFGAYLHHAPSDDVEQLENWYETTKQLYQSEFNVNLLATGYSAHYLRAGGCP